MYTGLREAVKRRLFACSSEETILVAGAPRSGTTWLSEIVGTLPGYKLLDEPLHRSAFSEVCERGFDWRTSIEPEETAPEKEEYLERAFSGRFARGWKVTSNTKAGRIVEHLTHSKAIIKTVRSNRMQHWISNTLNPRRILLIIRHPCAVVSSMLNYEGAWDGTPESASLDKPDEWLLGEISQSVRTQLPDIGPLTTSAEIWATVWCVDYFIPLQVHSRRNFYPWMLIPYERIVAQGEKELKRLFFNLEADVPPAALERLRTPSGSASDDLHTRQADTQLTKWKKKLTTEQIDSVLRVVHAFGFDMYTNETHPDYGQLNRLQDNRWRW